MLRRTTSIAAAVVFLAVVGACSSDDSTAAETTSSTTTTAPAAPIEILVTDDDGIGAPGIDALVNALLELENVEVTVVAPAANQSGSSDQTTPGGVSHAAGATASGVEGTAVDGFPADSVNVALDELGLTPDLVVSGVNEGQNVGPFTPLSGTVGAARTALRRGIPAVASSAGLEEGADYEIGAQLVVDWIVEHRDELEQGTAQTDTVTSFNVPDCQQGEPKSLVEVPTGAVIPEGQNVFATADCSIEAPAPTNDVEAMLGGYLAVTQVPADL